MGAVVDAVFPRYLPFVKYLKTGIYDGEATAILEDDSEVDGVVRIVEQRIPEKPYDIVRFVDLEDKVISTPDIASVRFTILGAADEALVRGIAKIAYAGIHYLLNHRDHSLSYRNYVNCPQLGMLRLFFNPNATKYIGKRFKGFSIADVSLDEYREIVRRFHNPHIRRHFILAKQEGRDIAVFVVLLSQEFWKVVIYNYSLPTGISEVFDEALLTELSPLRDTFAKGPSNAQASYVLHVKNPSYQKGSA